MKKALNLYIIEVKSICSTVFNINHLNNEMNEIIIDCFNNGIDVYETACFISEANELINI